MHQGVEYGLGLTSLIKSDPAWKVSKGSRSTSRRARKTATKSLKNCEGIVHSNSEDLSMPVSESEKVGVSTLGCRFSDKAEHVPIKKRRFLLRSPSPPPALNAPPAKETKELTKSQDVSHKLAAWKSASSDIDSSQIIDNNITIDASKSDDSNGRFSEDEDFSGIPILAAAACSSSLGSECGYAEHGSGVEASSALERTREISTNTEAGPSSKGLVKEDLPNSSEMSTGGTSSCISTEPVGELVSISTVVNFPPNVVAVGRGTEGASLGADSLILSGNPSCNKDEVMGGSQRLSRDHRLHWDLNVVMDAWEEPFDSLGVDNVVPHNMSQDAGKTKHDSKMESDKHDSRDELPTARVVPGELKALSNQASGGTKENCDFDVSRNIDQRFSFGGTSLLSNPSFNSVVGKCSSEDTKYTSHDTVITANGLVVTTSDNATQLLDSGAVNETDNGSVKNQSLNGDKHHNDQPVLQDFNLRIGVSSTELENMKNVCGSDANWGPLTDTSISCHVSSSSDNLREVMPNLAISQDVQDTLSTGKGLPHFSVCTEAPNSTATCELLVALDTKLQDVGNTQGGNLVHTNDTTMSLSEIHPVASRNSFDSHFDETGKTNSDKRQNDSDNIDGGEHKDNVGVRCDPVSVAEPAAALEHQDGYDSQYEDGELRESNERAWEEYDGVDREAEHVDYGSDNIETCIVNPSAYHDSESRQVEDRMNRSLGVAAVVSPGGGCVDDDVRKKAAKAIGDVEEHDEDDKIKLTRLPEEMMKALREKELLGDSKSSSDMATGLFHDDGLVDSKVTETVVEPKAFRRGLQSQIEGAVSRDGSSREERLNRNENRFESGSMRSFERGRYTFNSQARGRQGESWDGSSDNHRGYKRHYSPIIHRRSKLDDAIVERDGIGCGGTQDEGSYTHQLHQNTRPGADEEPCAGLQARYRPDRKFSPDRATGYGRGRSFRYGPLVESRGGRGRYHGPSPDESFQSSLKYRRPLSRRERSISPFGGRGQSNMHHSRGKSPSRSRSRSPIMWHSPRGRPGVGSGGNTFFRRRSKSPNFRSEVRVQRLRSPSHQHGFGADHAVGFRSIPRTHSSPPRNRWNSGRKDELGQFRGFGYKQRTTALEGSPGRIRLRGDRDSVIDPPRNLKPDGYYRNSDDGGCRGLRYEENYEDRRKPYNFLRPARRSYEDGMASRLHQDIDDSFSMGNNVRDRDSPSFHGRGGFRGMDSRIGDPPRRFRGEQQSFMCERDGKFNSNSKQFGVDVMDSSRNLKSEQYRPNHMGRFSDMDGANRVRRYANYEERRKHFGTNLMRCSDNEGTEERLNHNDENSPDAPAFCGRGTRGFDGRIGSLSTRLREDKDPTVCGREEKLDNSAQAVGVQNSENNDATKGTILS